MKFSEGGQPIYLDDLSLLQENHFDMWKSFLGVMTLNAPAFLLEGVKKESLGGNRVRVSAGKIVVDGTICPFEGTELEGSTVYVLVKRNIGEYREFEDGQTRGCVETMTATLSTSVDGADMAYKLTELKTFLELLSRALEAGRTSDAVPVLFFNGYSGSVSIRKSMNGMDTEMVVDIKSSDTEWNPEALGYKGMLFRIDDDFLANPFIGKNSKKFTHAGTEYRIGIGSSGVVSLELGSGRDNYYEDSYVLPLIPIKMTFRLSEFVNA